MSKRYNSFKGLAIKRFGENEQAAKEWVADLGRAAYFWQMKPGISIRIMMPYREIMPEFFVIHKGQVISLNWKNAEFRQRAGRGMPT